VLLSLQTTDFETLRQIKNKLVVAEIKYAVIFKARKPLKMIISETLNLWLFDFVYTPWG